MDRATYDFYGLRLGYAAGAFQTTNITPLQAGTQPTYTAPANPEKTQTE